jgi:hypothetical protein
MASNGTGSTEHPTASNGADKKIPKHSITDFSKEVREHLNAMSSGIEAQFEAVNATLRELKVLVEAKPQPAPQPTIVFPQFTGGNFLL